MSQALLTATGLGAVSLAYKAGGMTTVILGNAVEGLTRSALLSLMSTKDADDTLQTIRRHSVQYMLMELDVEAKVSCTRTLVANLRAHRENTEYDDNDYVEVCLKSVSDIMDELLKVLHRIYNELDEHRLRWFSGWRSPQVDEDMVLLRTMCKVFDSRLDTLVKCLGVSSHYLANGEENEASSQLAQIGFFKGPPTDMNKYETETTNKEAVSTENLSFFSDSVLL